VCASLTHCVSAALALNSRPMRVSRKPNPQICIVPAAQITHAHEVIRTICEEVSCGGASKSTTTFGTASASASVSVSTFNRVEPLRRTVVACGIAGKAAVLLCAAAARAGVGVRCAGSTASVGSPLLAVMVVSG
jgi:hypothetical protein